MTLNSVTTKTTLIFALIVLTGLTSSTSFAFGKKKPEVSPSQGFVVLIPGASSSGEDVYLKNVPMLFANKYFRKFQGLLNDAGVENLVCPETSDDDRASIEEREEVCVQQILKEEKIRGNECKTGSVRDVVLMGHSMGGLVARELAQDARVSSCIKSVVGVSTPNKGSAIADFAISEEAAGSFYGDVASFIGFTPDNLRYLDELRSDRSAISEENLETVFHAQDIPDNANVDYYSISTSFSKNLLDNLEPIAIMRGLIADELQKLGLDQTSYGTLNDGVVPEYSQIHGKYLGHLEVNHMESACVDLVSLTPGCSAAADFIIPILQAQVVLK
jgi:hypothetical protein